MASTDQPLLGAPPAAAAASEPAVRSDLTDKWVCCCGILCPTASKILLYITLSQSALVIFNFISSSFIFGCLFLGLFLLGLLAWRIEGPLLPVNALANLGYGCWQRTRVSR